MRTIVILIVLLMLVIGASAVLMQNNPGAESDLSPVAHQDTRSFDLTSAANGHDYRISVALPRSYDSSQQSYPVVYLMDPMIMFGAVADIMRFMSMWEELPEVIVVGIGYPVDTL